MLALCLMLLGTYYAQNYAGIIGRSLSNERQPWFYRDLGSSTTDDIEARICISYSNYAAGGVVVDQLELYIH